jgi:hypothetical protein
LDTNYQYPVDAISKQKVAWKNLLRKVAPILETRGASLNAGLLPGNMSTSASSMRDLNMASALKSSNLDHFDGSH